MQDEVNEKTVALSFRAARLTKETLMKAIQMYLRHRQGKKMRNIVQKHGKISVKELVGQGQGASSIEVGKDDIKDFERIARKY
ncbi:MAG: PcfB family protein, partial [Lachnospiraceae bacterium]|nr:PcfB family protein [Lachnospiraceae bacterium]